jgi:2-phosphoglycerate kinase
VADKRLYLIGGSSGAGKTTAAARLARTTGWRWVQADTVWRALAAVLPPESPEGRALQVDEAIREGTKTAEALVEQHIAASEVVCRAMTAAIFFELRTTCDALIVDGSWLLPAWMAGLAFPGLSVEVRPVLIHEPDQLEVKAAMRARSPFPATLPRQELGARVSALYGDWLRHEAADRGIPVVAARPRESLAERVAAALGPGPAGDAP